MPRQRGESLASHERLRRRADFKRCYELGARHHGKHCVLFAVANEERSPRLGMTVSRKVGKAVVRNRVRRRIREIYRRWNHRSELPAADLVVHTRPSAGAAPFRELKQDLERQMRRVIRAAHAGLRS